MHRDNWKQFGSSRYRRCSTVDKVQLPQGYARDLTSQTSNDPPFPSLFSSHIVQTVLRSTSKSQRIRMQTEDPHTLQDLAHCRVLTITHIYKCYCYVYCYNLIGLG